MEYIKSFTRIETLWNRINTAAVDITLGAGNSFRKFLTLSRLILTDNYAAKFTRKVPSPAVPDLECIFQVYALPGRFVSNFISSVI